jgi:hypothetical protein
MNHVRGHRHQDRQTFEKISSAQRKTLTCRTVLPRNEASTARDKVVDRIIYVIWRGRRLIPMMDYEVNSTICPRRHPHLVL